MGDRFLVWLGTGIVTVGVSAALLAGAGVATATDGESSDGGGSKTSESSDSAGSKGDSGAGKTSPSGPNAKDQDKQGDDPAGAKSGEGKDEDAKDDDAKDEDAKDEATGKDDEEATGKDDEEATDDKDGEDATDEATVEDATVNEATDEAGELAETPEGAVTDTGSHSNRAQAGDPQATRWTTTVVDDGSAAKVASENLEKDAPAPIHTEPEAAEKHAVVALETAFAEVAEVTEQTATPEIASVTFMSAATAEVTATATAQPLNVLLDFVGTIVFGLYGLVVQAVGGPPVVPPNSTVTVLSSRLRIDCGCEPGAGESVPVDWYIPDTPEGEDPPDRLIYLQHGFLASAPWYSYTAATLAEQTNSVVVAPSITSNFLAIDGCWLGGATMHEAMADLFERENTALAESALAAGYDGRIPGRVVLMGHSLGGGAVSGIAGYMTDDMKAGRTDDRLAGVVLLDGVGLNGRMADDLKKVDEGIPIYQLAAPEYFWNQFGIGTDALLEARPDADFYGVTLVGGSHVDTMRGGNWLIQFAQQLVSGFSKPQNVAAAAIVMVGWVNDMFEGDQDEGIYLDRGESLTIDTPAGQATLVDLPNQLTKPFILNFLEPFTALTGSIFNFQPGCVAESIGAAAACTDSIAA